MIERKKLHMDRRFVRDWMTRDPITVNSRTPLPDAHQIMVDRRIRRLPVVDDGVLVGIVTRGDIRGAQPSEATSLSIYEVHYLLSRLTIGQIMSPSVITVTPDTTVQAAAALMLKHKVAGLPVVEDGHVAGIITESDLFRMVAQSWIEEMEPAEWR
jgi:CBS domain-containing protein